MSLEYILLSKINDNVISQKNRNFEKKKTLIYESIMMKIYVNANIMKTQIAFNEVLPQKSLKLTFSPHNMNFDFIITLT